MAFNTDVDIDVADRDKVLELFKHVPAKLTDNKKHKTGVYFHNVPADYLNGTCAIDYKQADDIGFFKLDVINNSAYKDIDSNKIDELISENHNWDLLLDPKIDSKLFFYDVKIKSSFIVSLVSSSSCLKFFISYFICFN